ncbi:hypothetical protein CXB51_022395 [Gossypium anomalum]|uniref:Retrovirus-related Pol polyprotein from transposon TNT 1-94 n=1 Tax=Gossypium anomalum TaxID=47600 RepID=A0A8J6CV49_9ROSI|nr:hypothetical protein CXB51_022395 [Gossypium anomalum]
MDLEDALLGIDKMPSTLTNEEKKRKDRKALTQLHLHLSNEILQDVMKEKIGAALCKRLKQILFKEILSNLKVMEVQYDKEDLGLILLCSLPPSYSTFRDTILYSRESLTVDETLRERVSLFMGDKIEMLMMIVEGHWKEILSVNRKVDQSLQTEGGCESKGKQPEKSGEADVVEDYSDGKLLVASINNSKGSTVTGDAVVASSSLKVVISRDVVFDETAMLPNLSLKDSSNKENQKQVLELEQLDVKTVFLHEELEEDIYMQQPEGFTVLKKKELCLLAEKVPSRFETVTKTVSTKLVSTLLVAHFRILSGLSPQSDDEIEYMSHVPYPSAVGSLMYAMICSRPDLSYAFGKTRDGVIRNVDVDFARDLDRSRSFTGYVFTIESCAINWKATLQTTIALSTTEAEYMAIIEACKEAI